MRKHVWQWSILLLSICLLRILAPSLMLRFAGIDFTFAVFGSFVALLAIVLTSRSWGYIDFQPVFAIGALASLALFLICLYSPTLGSIRHTYVSLTDIFIALESSVILGFAALHPTKEDALPVLTAAALTVQLLHRRLRTAVPARQLNHPRYS